MLKKLLAIILVCTIAAGVLSGCGKTGDSDTAQTNTDENTQTDTENVTDTDISDLKFPLSAQ